MFVRLALINVCQIIVQHCLFKICIVIQRMLCQEHIADIVVRIPVFRAPAKKETLPFLRLYPACDIIFNRPYPLTFAVQAVRKGSCMTGLTDDSGRHTEYLS